MAKTHKEIEQMCVEEAQLSLCSKRKVGAILVKICSDKKSFTVLSKGHNYNPDGTTCEKPDGSTKTAVIHAEISCLNNHYASRQTKDCSNIGDFNAYMFNLNLASQLYMFVSHQPCDNCKARLDFFGIKAVVSSTFMKFDNEKPRMALVPVSLGVAAANALTYGAKKYKPNNWRKIDNVEQYVSALTRHIDAWREGEDNDPESGLCHLDHAAANLCFLIELKKLPKMKG